MRSVFYRGGGELGREWYLDGKLQNKHKGFEVYTCQLKNFVAFRVFYRKMTGISPCRILKLVLKHCIIWGIPTHS